jgi:hypothetical protein
LLKNVLLRKLYKHLATHRIMSASYQFSLDFLLVIFF